MRTPRYPSDLTDAQWALVRSLLPVYPGGRPRTTRLRDVVDAIFYVLKTGCQWRALPGDVPPTSTVWRSSDAWRHDGTLDAVHDRLRRAVRTAAKPSAPRTTAGIDRRSVDTTSGGAARGRGNAKAVAGRKRHVLVGGMGVRLAVPATAASGDDATAAQEWPGRRAGQPAGKERRAFADGKAHNYALPERVATTAPYKRAVVRRPARARGWVRLPLRRTAERPFAWLGKCRRRTKDRARSVRSAEAVVKRAMIRPMLNRLEPTRVEPAVRYRSAA